MRNSQTKTLFLGIALASLLAWPGCATDDPDGGDPSVITFSMLRVEDLGPNRAVMRGDTSIGATCAVDYGLSMDDLEWTATDPEMEEGEFAINHQVPLEDLAPETTYYLRARAEGPDGEFGESEIISFTTPVDEGQDPTDSMTNVAMLEQGTEVMEVSSNWSGGDNDSSFGIHNALDGMESSEWSTSSDGNDAWVRLDFGQPRELSYFAYRSRMMQDGTSIVTSVQIVVEDQNDMVLGPFVTPDHTVRYVFALPEGLTAQKVRVEAVETTGGNTGAREIQFF